MKGLAIAEAFFNEWGRPNLQHHFPELGQRFAAGRLQGSDVLGADDEISRDHCWGPQFWLFLSADDFLTFGEEISSKLNALAPNPWRGFRLAGGGDQAVRVTSIPQWFADHVGSSSLPSSVADWNPHYESALYFLRHGAVWFDGSGELSRWRAAWARYPEEVRLKRLKEECFRAWHHGEYNFVQRMVRRRDPLAVALAVGEFTLGVMRLRFLLQGDFAPYWKWLAHEFRKLPGSGYYDEQLRLVVADGDFGPRAEAVKAICARLRDEMMTAGVIQGDQDNPWLLGLLNAHEELGRRLTALGVKS